MVTRGKKRAILLILMRTLPLGCSGAATTAEPSAATTAEPSAATAAGTYRAGQSFDISLSSGGVARDAWLHVPAGYSAAAPVSLILNFHGDGSNGKEQEALSAMSALADRQGFLVAYPNGLNEQWSAASGSAGAADRQFVRDLVSKLQADYKVDPKRIYATGMSNGGGMTNRVGCDLADLFAAVAPVEGGYGDWTDCSPSRPMPIMAFHGLTDVVVPYNGGPGTGPAAGHTFPSIPEWAAAWAARDSCNASAAETHPNADVTRQEWPHCAGGASVVLYSIDHHGDSWPGSKVHPAITSQAIDATTVMWSSFQAHPMP
jgi:polyhydroxybutyrate depolymerase